MKHRIPINFQEIARVTGIRNMKIGYSDAFHSWMAWNMNVGGVNAGYFNPPYDIGDTYEGKRVTFLRIVDDEWEMTLEEIKKWQLAE